MSGPMLRDGRRFRKPSHFSLQEWTSNRWFAAAVRWVDGAVDAGGVGGGSAAAAAEVEAQAALIKPLLVEWETLVRTGRERRPGQLDALLSELGPMPSSAAPDELALWTAALLNPFPTLGVALEIRPEVLTAPSAARRLQVVLLGLRDSIRRLRQTPRGEPLFD
jgi:hypothetical protein